MEAIVSPRIAPLSAPYPAEVQAVFDRIMPPGMDPLVLFRTLSSVPRIWEKFRAGSLLDKGPLDLRQREIVIDRVCARCDCAYEWGVHIALFAKRVALTEAQIQALATDGADAAVWSEEERLLIRAVDALHDTIDIPDALWSALAATFSHEQILEVVALCGFYRTVAYFCRALRLPTEAYGAALTRAV
ncbi:MAG: carboxymuconolactone decarboxylase family protein [Alphaproteobacteria bacterium]|nr:carboxymuconolactone decarboxylase family protein [Alphaproteobacteria bacterium]